MHIGRGSHQRTQQETLAALDRKCHAHADDTFARAEGACIAQHSQSENVIPTFVRDLDRSNGAGGRILKTTGVPRALLGMRDKLPESSDEIAPNEIVYVDNHENLKPEERLNALE